MSSGASKILLEEHFSAEDDRFVDELTKFHSYQFLLSFVEKWIADQRDWSRRQVVEYISSDLNFPGHEVVFKRLFKHFEQAGDQEMMVHFVVATDRLVRRTRIRTRQYDWRTRQRWDEEFLFAKPNKSIVEQVNRYQTVKHAFTRAEVKVRLPDVRNRPQNRIFSHKTRNYLRRRVWRNFRRLSFTHPDAYVENISKALALYQDEDFAAGENVLDNWSLMHACYFHHKAIAFGAAHTNLVEVNSLSELSPAPYQATAWQSTSGANALLYLMREAKSTLVRLWSMESLNLFHQEHLSKIELSELTLLLSHPDTRIQEFAIDLFSKHPRLPSLTIVQWLELLEISNDSVLTLICDSMRKHVRHDRLTSEQILQLTSAQPVPVARLGLEILKQRHASQPFSTTEIASLAEIQCEHIAEELTDWCLGQIGTEDKYQVDTMVAYFDSRLPVMRQTTMNWASDPNTRAYDDPALWSRLVETPYDDVRIQMIEALEARSRLPGQDSEYLSHAWISVILGIQRGNRTKLKAVRQVARAIEENVVQAERLLPVLIVACRSCRGPEQRNALATLVRLGTNDPRFRHRIQERLAELEWLEDAPS